METMSNPLNDGVEPESVEAWLFSFFSTLERRGAVYAVLRFDATLVVPDCEIDLLVDPSSLTTVLGAIRDICVQHPHLKVLQWRLMPRHAATVTVVWRDSDQEWRYYAFDIRCGIRKRGYVLLDGGSLRGLTVWDDQLHVRRLRDEFERALLLVRNELDGRQPSPRHMAIMTDRTTGDLSEAMRVLGWRVTDSDGSPIARATTGRLTRAVSSLRYSIRAIYGRARQRTVGLNVIIYGPDGVGKSTQAQLIADFFKRVRIRKVHTYHHLVENGSVGSPMSGGAQVAKARAYKRASRRSTAGAVILLSYLKKLWIVVTRLRPRMRIGHAFVHDRYLLDVFQKSFKTHGRRVYRLERFLSPLTPTEPHVIVLAASPQVVAGRTGELTTGEVTAAYDLLFDCLKYGGARFLGWLAIDANQSISETHECIVEHIVDVQTRRVLEDGRAGT